jgi:NDP-sugar pyrophosphorylase family protein
MQTSQAMIFAAGLGTRLKPITDRMPKALVPVGGQPLLWHVIQKLRAAGFERIVINVHHFADQIIDYIEANQNFGLDIRISDERVALLDTGGGIKHALPLFDPSMPILIHNVDILSNVDLAALYHATLQSQADALLLVSQRQTKRYLLFADDDRLCGWTNIETGEVKGSLSTIHYPPSTIHHSPSTIHHPLKQLAFSGIHVLSPSTFSLFEQMPDRFSIIDFYLQHASHCFFKGKAQENLRLLDVGKLDSLEQAEEFLM